MILSIELPVIEFFELIATHLFLRNYASPELLIIDNREIGVRYLVASGLAILSGCSESTGTSKDSLGLPRSKQAYYECKFDLAKIEAIRGRNLDDLNRGVAIARNQFLADCMAAKNQFIPDGGLEDQMAYTGKTQGRKPNEIRLNRSAEGPHTFDQ